ncbi:MAG: hypothetical protein A07HB70_00411, partial [uncultured archaeon A07HB70]
AVVVCDVAPTRPAPEPSLDYGHSHAKARFRGSFVE